MPREQSYYADSPKGLAYRMAGYQRDAEYIRNMVLRDYGRAPSVATIKEMQKHHQKQKEAFNRSLYVDGNFSPKTPLGRHFQVAGLVKQDAPAAAKPKPVVAVVEPVAKAKPPKPKTIWPSWYIPPSLRRHPSFELIEKVAADFGVTVGDIKGQTRRAIVVTARRVICKILRDRGISLPVIGKLLGGRDHSTIMHAVSQFDNQADTDIVMMDVYMRRRDI